MRSPSTIYVAPSTKIVEGEWDSSIRWRVRAVGSTIRDMKWVLFFDGDCAICSASIRWVNQLDSRGRVDFAPLQGKLAEKLALGHHANESGGTMVLMREHDGRLFFRSDALIELASAIGGIARCLALLALVPRAWRDGIYQFVADRRQLLAGKNPTCAIPDERLRRRIRE